jgi:hypothetical protein
MMWASTYIYGKKVITTQKLNADFLRMHANKQKILVPLYNGVRLNFVRLLLAYQ